MCVEAFVVTKFYQIFSFTQLHQGVKILHFRDSWSLTLGNFYTLMQLSAREDFIEFPATVISLCALFFLLWSFQKQSIDMSLHTFPDIYASYVFWDQM